MGFATLPWAFDQLRNGMVEQPISHSEILIYEKGRASVVRLFLDVFGRRDGLDKCSCGEGIIRL